MANQCAWGAPALPFLAVGRIKDGVILAYYCVNDNTEEQRELNKDVFRKLLAAAGSKLSNGQRTRLQWNEGSVCCLMDQQGALLYCAVTTLLTYPERLAYQLLYDLVVAVQQLGDSRLEAAPEQSLNEELQPRMRSLVQQYEDPANFPQLQVAMDRLSQPTSFETTGGRAGFQVEQGGTGAALATREQRQQRLMKMLGLALGLLILLIYVCRLFARGSGQEVITTTAAAPEAMTTTAAPETTTAAAPPVATTAAAAPEATTTAAAPEATTTEQEEEQQEEDQEEEQPMQQVPVSSGNTTNMTNFLFQA